MVHGRSAEVSQLRLPRLLVVTLAVAAITAYVSYWHTYAVVRAHGETGITAGLEPTTIDGLVYASSMVALYAARLRLAAPCWPIAGRSRGGTALARACRTVRHRT